MNKPDGPQRLPAVAPLEQVRLPIDLDGRGGLNRGSGPTPQISATTDVEAIAAWLARCADSPRTFSSYRKEAERLMLWSVIERGKAFSSLTHEDLLTYQRFLADPQPAARWVLTGARKRARTDPMWRPFVGPLAPASQRQALVILNALFAWLVQAGYLAGNPLSLSRHRARRVKPRVTRFLDPVLWHEVKKYIEGMPRETERQRAHAERVRWFVTLLYLGGLRISEVSENTMGHFFCRRDKEGTERWWLEITGKGNKQRLVPATQEFMVELARYRRAKGYAPFPTPGEQTPLVLPIGKSRKRLTRAALHGIAKGVFEGAADQIQLRGDDFAVLADQLRRASAHWLRHTAGSHMADKQIDLRLIRDNLGHESLNTTSLYMHVDEDRRHKETDEKHRIAW